MAENYQQSTDDRLLNALRKCEDRLHEWIHKSENNARWFGRDPLAAMQAAELGIDPGLMDELQAVTRAIQGKLRATNPPVALATGILAGAESAE